MGGDRYDGGSARVAAKGLTSGGRAITVDLPSWPHPPMQESRIRSCRDERGEKKTSTAVSRALRWTHSNSVPTTCPQFGARVASKHLPILDVRGPAWRSKVSKHVHSDKSNIMSALRAETTFALALPGDGSGCPTHPLTNTENMVKSRRS